MTNLREEIVDTIDANLSVDDGSFWYDLRFLAFLPVFPALVGMFLLPEGEPITASPILTVLGVVGGVTMVPWTIYLFKRQALKKRNWVAPAKFSDDRGTY